MTKYLLTPIFLFLCIEVYGQNLIEVVPIKFVDNYIFVEITINNKSRPLNFWFDTGAGITVIDTDVAKQLSIDVTGESKINTSGKSLVSKESALNELKIGEKLNLENITLVLMDLSHLSKYLNTNVDGVIGYDLLEKFITETNIDDKKIRFYSPIDYVFKGNAKTIELTTLESNLFGILIETVPKNQSESTTLNLQIDTGADNYLTFHNKIVKEHQLINSKKRQKTIKGFGADSSIVTNVRGKVSQIGFGDKKWRNVPVTFEVDPINSRENSLADGLLGQRLLLDFNITYNLKERLVYFEKRK
jgi:predicted aspartyl protease